MVQQIKMKKAMKRPTPWPWVMKKTMPKNGADTQSVTKVLNLMNTCKDILIYRFHNIYQNHYLLIM